MTEDELGAIILGIAPIIKEQIAAAVADLRDRIVVAETKAAQPPPADPAIVTLREQSTAQAKDIDALREKVANVLRDQELGTQRTVTWSERLAVLETKAPIPGPAGKDGEDGVKGLDGQPGKDGADGLGFDDLAVDFDGDRTLVLSFMRGLQKKSFPIVLPFLRYQGVYNEGKAYTSGDVVTWAGSTWTAHEPTTTKPGDGSKAWTLAVKRGRDGKDGRDAVGALPLVKVGK